MLFLSSLRLFSCRLYFWLFDLIKMLTIFFPCSSRSKAKQRGQQQNQPNKLRKPGRQPPGPCSKLLSNRPLTRAVLLLKQLAQPQKPRSEVQCHAITNNKNSYWRKEKSGWKATGTQAVMIGHARATRNTLLVNERRGTLVQGLHDQERMRWAGPLILRGVRALKHMRVMKYHEAQIEIKVLGKILVLICYLILLVNPCKKKKNWPQLLFHVFDSI